MPQVSHRPDSRAVDSHPGTRVRATPTNWLSTATCTLDHRHRSYSDPGGSGLGVPVRDVLGPAPSAGASGTALDRFPAVDSRNGRMPIMRLVIILLLSSTLWAQDSLPVGSILAVRLNSSLNTRKTRPGQAITARVMQSVPNSRIRQGAKVLGHVLVVTAASKAHPAEVSFRFDAVRAEHRSFVVGTDLRALASAMDVEDAQIPPTGPDRGTPWAWATRNLIGGEVAYGEGGPVARGTETVGKALAEGILARPQPDAARGCRGEIAGNAHPQALWVFSSDACGVYGFPSLKIAHAGRGAPAGEITISSPEDINIRSGSGMLLRVNSEK